MKRLKLSSPASRFWIGLVGYVLFADMFLWRKRRDTMSIQWGKWLQTKRGRTVCAAGWGFLTAHLFWSVPIPGQTQLKKIATYKGKRVL